MGELDGMPIISMWQPWAQWILETWKLAESRTHNRFKNLLGKRIGIHATAKWDPAWSDAASNFLPYERRMQTFNFARLKPSVICTAKVVDYRMLQAGTTDELWALIECTTPRWGLFLEDVQPIRPAILCRGRQGIFYLRPALEDANGR